MFVLSFIFCFVFPAGLHASFCTKFRFDKNENPIYYQDCCSGYEKYLKNDSYDCKAICENGCDNGTCIDPNHCKCHKGYRNIDNNRSLGCESIYPKDCKDGSCVGAGVLECEKGFQLNETSGSCTPICSKGCPNGPCASPDSCVLSSSSGVSLKSAVTDLLEVFNRWKIHIISGVLLSFVLYVIISVVMVKHNQKPNPVTTMGETIPLV